MNYQHMMPGIFQKRPNRFIAHIEIEGKEEICHVKNTGRCRELLIPGTKVWCQKNSNPMRKTKFDLITVQKQNRLINMDAQVPNVVAKQWLEAGGLGKLENLRDEVVYEDSRFDFSFEKDSRPYFLEVKGVTLENNGICAFPDAPTVRGTKHLNGLSRAVGKGYGAYVLFVIQMENVNYFHPNTDTDPAFTAALRSAVEAGVQVIAMDCRVSADSIEIRNPVPIHLTDF